MIGSLAEVKCSVWRRGAVGYSGLRHLTILRPRRPENTRPPKEDASRRDQITGAQLRLSLACVCFFTALAWPIDAAEDEALCGIRSRERRFEITASPRWRIGRRAQRPIAWQMAAYRIDSRLQTLGLWPVRRVKTRLK